MARKNTADAAKDKAAKQKKIVIGLAVFLALAMAYAVHTMSSLKGGGAASAKPQAVAADASTAPAPATTPVDSATPVAPSLAGAPAPTDPAATAVSGATTAGSDSSQLVSVLIPKADSGQLDSFSRFETKDPFAAGGPSSASGGSSGTSGKGGTSGTTTTPKTPPPPPAPPPTSAVISINGTSEAVQSGSNFPLANPVATTNGLFELVSLDKTTAKVSVVGGSYSSGSQTLTLHVNKPVTLVNTADGMRYTLLLYPQGTAAPAATPASGASTTPAVTAPPSGP